MGWIGGGSLEEQEKHNRELQESWHWKLNLFSKTHSYTGFPVGPARSPLGKRTEDHRDRGHVIPTMPTELPEGATP